MFVFSKPLLAGLVLLLFFGACRREPNTPLPSPQTPSYFVDTRDDQVYQTVQIAGKEWLAENLRFNAPNSRRSAQFPLEIYGRLYLVSNLTGLCPSGWELPSQDDYRALLEEARSLYPDNRLLAKALRSTSGWQNENGDNNLGFNAYPTGRYSQMVLNGLGQHTQFLTRSRTFGSTSNTYRGLALFVDSTDVFFSTFSEQESHHYACRCVRPIPQNPQAQTRPSAPRPNANPITQEVLLNPWACQPRPQDQATGPDVFIDPRDSQAYHTVWIGPKRWFAQNCRYYPNHSSLQQPQVFSNDMRCNQANPSSDYGRLYTEHDLRHQTICPNGWHVSTSSDWDDLAQTLGADSLSLKLRAWGNGLNSAGFNALPAGTACLGCPSTVQVAYFGLGQTTGFWFQNGNDFQRLELNTYSLELNRNPSPSSQALSCRCVQD